MSSDDDGLLRGLLSSFDELLERIGRPGEWGIEFSYPPGEWTILNLYGDPVLSRVDTETMSATLEATHAVLDAAIDDELAPQPEGAISIADKEAIPAPNRRAERPEDNRPRHREEGTKLKKRRTKRHSVAVVLGMILGTAAVAVAAFIVTTELTGSLSAGEFAVYGESGSTTAVASTGTCTVTMTDNGSTDGTPTFDVSWTGGPIAGDTCVLTLAHAADGSNAVDAVIDLATISPSITGGEVTLTLGTSCGTQLAPGTSDTIDATLTITQQADPGTAYDLTGSELRWVPLGTEDLGGCL